jgi:uncharacterized protein YndB with AHSA1/START domain
MQRVEKVIEIDAPIERVFDLFSDFENFPRWMRHIRDVHYSGRRYTRWKADAPFGTSVEWEAETTDFDPPHRIAWQSVRGDVDTAGEVDFHETRRGTTIMRVILEYRPPAGRLGSLVASLFGKDPEQQLEEDLQRFRNVAEGGGPRRRPEHMRDVPRRVGPAYDEARPRRYAPRHGKAEMRDVEAIRERERRRRFDASLAEETRRREGPRRRDEGERDDRILHGRGRDERRLDFDEDWDERLGQPLGRDERVSRHALTPRERERERRERTPDFDYSREAFRRGVDKLMEDPPSRRWRRWD